MQASCRCWRYQPESQLVRLYPTLPVNVSGTPGNISCRLNIITPCFILQPAAAPRK